MTIANVVDLANATDFATQCMLAEPNMFGSVTWGCADDGRDPADRIRDLFQTAARFLRRHGVSPVWVWVRECGDTHGDHFHWAIYVPDHLAAAFKAVVRRSVKRFRVVKTIKGRPIKFGPVSGFLGGMPGLILYFIKDATDPARAAYGVPDRYRATRGPIIGLRYGVSNTIKLAARRAAGWNERPPPGAEIIPLRELRVAHRPDSLEAATRDLAA